MRILSGIYNRLKGAPSIANAQVAVDTTVGGVTIVAARSSRRSVTLYNTGSVTVYVGSGTVSAANGFPIPAGGSFTIDATAAVKGIAASGSQTVGVWEEYD